MPAQVSVLKAQLEELRESARRRHLRVVEGVAFGLPGEDVFHCFSTRPSYQPHGSPLPCFFVMQEGGRLPTELPRTLASLRAADKSPVVIVPFNGLDAPTAFIGTAMSERATLHLLCPLDDAASRSRGLLESGMLATRRVLIAGLGSFGSTAAVELAKAGVGSFALLDMDRLEPGNVTRHECGLADVGRWKTLAVRDAILARNPAAKVDTFELDLNTRLDLVCEEARRSDLVICVTDQARSRFNCNVAALSAARPALFARAITRATGGDVFRMRPGGPCLSCLFNQGLSMGEDEVASERAAAERTPDYAPPGSAVQAQPGLACDIAPLVQMLVKLALVELAPRGIGHWERLREDLAAPFYIWANRRDDIYRDWQAMDYLYNRNSIMRWYGVRVPRDSSCMSCSMS